MFRYFVRRVAQMVPVVVLALAVNFSLIHLAPGDPITYLAGDHGSEAYFAEMRGKYGLDRPLPEQFARFALGALRGDFGYSFSYGQPVLAAIVERVPATLLLMLTAQLVAAVVGIWVGTVAALKSNSWTGVLLRTGAALCYALPSFWVGQLLILIFAFKLGLFPVHGMESIRESYEGLRRALDIAHHLVLPATALGLMELGLVLRLTRTTVSDLVGEDFIRTAHAKGLSARLVMSRHVLKNALLPVVTVIGNRVGMLLTGAVLVEIVFAWPGLGRLLYEAALARDYPLLMAMFFITSLCVVVVNLITDLVYTLLDPRVRYA